MLVSFINLLTIHGFETFAREASGFFMANINVEFDLNFQLDQVEKSN